jgi:Skp family chaperone for outer membrane proteins
MIGLVIAASLALVLGAAPGFAQTPAQPKPAQQAQAPPAQPPARAVPAPQPPAPFPQGAKMAFVNLQQIATLSAEGKAANAKVQALIQKKQAEGGEKAKTLAANQQKLQASGGVMSDAARSQLEKDIERQQREGERFQQDAQAEVTEMQQELQNEFQKKLLPVLQQLAQEKELQLLFSAADAGIVWADAGLDLTMEAVKKLDAAKAPGK